GLDYQASEERISAGVPGLDAMLGGKGYFRGSSIMISGTAGTGKSSLAAHFADATCRRGERCLLFAFEESPAQILRNMRSIGLDLQRWIDKGLLRIEASRPTVSGLEMHLVQIHKRVIDFEPRVVILDPISNFTASGSALQAEAMLVRMIDFLKMRDVTAMLVSLTTGEARAETTGISSLIDTWVLVHYIEVAGEHRRVLHVLKSRGMPHSNQVQEFRITPSGIALAAVAPGPKRGRH